jgi:TPR repeat protein
MKPFNRSVYWVAGLVLAAACLAPALRAAEETELKDAAGNTIVKYAIEVPAGIAAAGTTDPAKQVGLIFCFQEHGTPTGNDLFPVHESLRRLGILNQYVLLAPHSQEAAGKMLIVDHEPMAKVLAWALKTYPINPRRVYMYGKGEGAKFSGEFTMTHPNLVTAAITYSWGWWLMNSETDKAIDPVNSAPEFYMVIGLRDYSHHIATVRETLDRVRFKGYHVIGREFDEGGERSYHPPSNDDALGWATRLRNKNIAPSAEEAKLLKAFGRTAPAPVNGYYPTLALVGGAPAGEILQKLFMSSDANVRLAAAETCRHGIFGDATTAALAKLVNDSSDSVRATTLRALTAYADWRYQPAQQALIALATDKNADLQAREDAADGIAQAIKLQATGLKQDPPMFRALVSLLKERGKTQALYDIAFEALAPMYTYAVGGADEGQHPPAAGWDKWLDTITAEQASDMTYYDVCANTPTDGGTQPVEMFCAGKQSLYTHPAQAFQTTLKAAEAGYVPAEEVVGMMYATGKGVQQDYVAAGKWFLTAAEGGDLRAPLHYSGDTRDGESPLRRNPELTARWNAFTATHPAFAPPQRQRNPANANAPRRPAGQGQQQQTAPPPAAGTTAAPGAR